MDFTSGKLDLDTYMQQAVNSVEVEDTTIRDRIESRRDLLARQDKCSRIQSALCDKIREGKKAIPGLSERVQILSDTDPEMFKYIQGLEFIQNSIWCATCNTQKNIGNKPAADPTQENIEKTIKNFSEVSAKINDLGTALVEMAQAAGTVINEITTELTREVKKSNDEVIVNTKDNNTNVTDDTEITNAIVNEPADSDYEKIKKEFSNYKLEPKELKPFELDLNCEISCSELF